MRPWAWEATPPRCSRLLRDARLLGIDQDASAIAQAREALAKFEGRVTFVQANFAEISSAMREAGFDHADAILADLGMSSFALDDAARGFSFRLDGPAGYADGPARDAVRL